MNRLRVTATTLGLLSACLAPHLRADVRNKETRVTVNAPLQVQDTLLAPGQYVFKLTLDDSQIAVSIYNAETNRIEATILGWAAYRGDAGDKQFFIIDQSRANQPAKLQKWFYPGDNFGVEFPLTNRTSETRHMKPNQKGQSTAAAGN
jgi:hypothetical protein